MPMVSVRSSVAAFLEYSAAVLSKSSTDGYRRYLSRFAAAHGERPLAELTPAIVRAWSAKWYCQQAARRLTSWATHEARLIASDPLDKMSLPKRGRRNRVASRAELLKLRRAAAAPLRRVLVALEESLARPHEIRRMRWEHVRMIGGEPAGRVELLDGKAFFLLPKFKGQNQRRDDGAVRVIPITARLGRLLVRLLRGPVTPGRFIFANSRGREWSGNGLRLAVRRTRDAAAIAADAFGENLVAYTLRHSGATAAVRAGVRDFRLAELMGHSTTRTTQRYVHLCPEDALRDAAAIAAARRGRAA